MNKVKVSRIVSCFDGDTFRADIDTWPKLFGHKIPIRIRGIDCPERSSKDPDEQLTATNAHAFTKSTLINAKEVMLENVQRGKYFRLIADVFVDGQNLAEMLVRARLAKRLKY